MPQLVLHDMCPRHVSAGILHFMEIAAGEPAVVHGAKSRWAVAYAWVAGLSTYCVTILIGGEHAAKWINDIAWTLASASAAIICFSASRNLDRARGSASARSS